MDFCANNTRYNPMQREKPKGRAAFFATFQTCFLPNRYALACSQPFISFAGGLLRIVTLVVPTLLTRITCESLYTPMISII